MNKKVYLHIQEPCHENWNDMTPAQQGKFCGSCCKTVTDFSNLSDNQILGILSKAAGNTCGRFTNKQLERAIQPTITPVIKPYKIFLSAFIPAFLFGSKISAQNNTKGKVRVTTTTEVRQEIMGDSIMLPMASHIIFGTVTFQNGQPAGGASIYIKGTRTGVSADEKGKFSISIPANVGKPTIEISYVGYQMQSVKLPTSNNKTVHIVLKESDQMVMGEVVTIGKIEQSNEEVEYVAPKVDHSNFVIIKGTVTNEYGEALNNATIKYGENGKEIFADDNGKFSIKVKRNESSIDVTANNIGFDEKTSHVIFDDNKEQQLTLVLKNNLFSCSGVLDALPMDNTHTFIAGGISLVMPPTLVDTVKTTVDKVLKNELFKIYPNPVSKNGNIKLIFKNAGHYDVQVFDNNGKLYLQKEIDIKSDSQNYALNLPSSLSAGNYYIKAINTKTKKQFIDKLIVQ